MTVAAVATFFPTKTTQIPMLVVDVDAADEVSKFRA